MRLFKDLAVNIALVAFCTASASPLNASRLNPVSWSLEPIQQAVAPESSVVLRLHAQVENGYRLYSFTTPRGGPAKTTASLESTSYLKDIRVYQPNPDRHQDSILNVPVETFTGGVDFFVTAYVTSHVGNGEKTVTATIHYQACSRQICVAPVVRTATASIMVRLGTATAATSIPKGYQAVTQASM